MPARRRHEWEGGKGLKRDSGGGEGVKAGQGVIGATLLLRHRRRHGDRRRDAADKVLHHNNRRGQVIPMRYLSISTCSSFIGAARVFFE